MLQVDRSRAEPRLEDMSTDWALFRVAHGEENAGASAARRKLVEPYLRQACKYLIGATRDPSVADDLLSEFWLSFMRGDFRGANPDHGELGRLIKHSLACLVIEFHRRECQSDAVAELTGLVDADELPAPDGHLNPVRLEARNALLDSAWEALGRFEEQHPESLHYKVLSLRVCYPDDKCEQLAQALSPFVEHRLTANAVRIALHDARVHFATAHWRAALEAVEHAGSDEAKSFLKDLGLWAYVSPLLEKNEDPDSPGD